MDENKRTAWENWRFQVDSGWNRSNYFAIVETVAVVAVWQVLADCKYPKTELFFAFLGLLSAIIWLLNDLINHYYIQHWWKETGQAEEYETKAAEKWWSSIGLKYSHLMHVIPLIFVAAWLWMLGLFMLRHPRFYYLLAVLEGFLLVWGVSAIFKCWCDRAHAASKPSGSTVAANGKIGPKT